MTKREADKILAKHLKELDGRTAKANGNNEYMQLVDSMLKVYTVLASSDDSFEQGAFGIPSGTIGM